MPRRQADVCMLCAPDPCECFAPKAKAAPRKKAAPKPAPPPEPVVEVAAPQPRNDLRERMKAAAAASQAPQIERVQPKETRRRAETPITKAAPAPRPVASDEQLLLNAALRALGPIMHPEDQERYQMLLSTSPTAAERKAEWKARRAWQQAEQ